MVDNNVIAVTRTWQPYSVGLNRSRGSRDAAVEDLKPRIVLEH